MAVALQTPALQRLLRIARLLRLLRLLLLLLSPALQLIPRRLTAQ